MIQIYGFIIITLMLLIRKIKSGKIIVFFIINDGLKVHIVHLTRQINVLTHFSKMLILHSPLHFALGYLLLICLLCVYQTRKKFYYSGVWSNIMWELKSLWKGIWQILYLHFNKLKYFIEYIKLWSANIKCLLYVFATLEKHKFLCFGSSVVKAAALADL